MSNEVETAVADQPTQTTSIFDEIDNEEAGTEAAETSASSTTADETASEPNAAEAQTTEDDSTYLPTEQEKAFPPETIAKYAKRYGYTAEEIAADPRLQRTLHDKINSDIQIAKDKAAANLQQDQPEEDEQADEPPVQQTPQEWEQKISNYVDHITDPQAAKKFESDFRAAWNIKDDSQRAVSVTKVMTAGMINVLRTAVPDLLFGKDAQGNTLLGQYLDRELEGIRDIHKTQSRAAGWDQVRQSDPTYAKLPAFGTPEFTQAIQKVAEIVPGFENAWFKDSKGNDLSPYQNFIAKSKVAARLMAGQKIEPEVVKQAVAKGKQMKEAQNKTLQNGRLGAGQSSKTAPQPTGNDDIFGEGEAEYKARHGRI